MKKFIIKSYKFCFVSRGPGETGQARALAKFLSKKGGRILFCLHQERNLFFLKNDKEFKVFLTPEPKDLKKILENEKSDFLFLFNSKMWGDDFKEECPFKKPKFVFCFDSNEKEMKEKLIPIGFIPSYLPVKRGGIKNELGIQKGEKLVFSYFSGFGAGYRSWALENFVDALDLLIKKGMKIKAIYIGPRLEIQRKWLIERGEISARKYFEILASSDLVFMHQGMVTLAQSISCQIPVICNVSILKTKLPRLHFWEVLPFKKAGVCEMFSKTTKVEKIKKRIEELLYEKKEIQKMRKKQREIFEKGEEKFFKEIQKICAN